MPLQISSAFMMSYLFDFVEALAVSAFDLYMKTEITLSLKLAVDSSPIEIVDTKILRNLILVINNLSSKLKCSPILNQKHTHDGHEYASDFSLYP